MKVAKMGVDLAREVVLKRVAVGVAAYIVGLLVTVFGFDLGEEGREAVTVLVLAVLSAVVFGAQAWWARRDVTPVSDPVSELGIPLVERTSFSEF